VNARAATEACDGTVSVAFDVAASPEAIRAAREAAVDVARRWGDCDVVERTRLLVSELVTNSIVHGGRSRPVNVRVRGEPAALRVEVKDDGPGFAPRPGAMQSSESGGFGLFLVDRLADRWGVAFDGATYVWFELDRRDSR
jgi:anti-sigma regulatory factor (Ser/Thr protein kinase)